MLASGLGDKDPLTGAFNRAAAVSILSDWIDQGEREAQIVGLAYIDIDHLKGVNDVYGHPAGDMVIREIAKILQVTFPRQSIICRFSGDEFLAVSLGISRSKFLEHADLVRRQVKRIHERIEGVALYPVTLAIGTAFFLKDGRTWDELVANADARMSRGKKQGGDVVISN